MSLLLFLIYPLAVQYGRGGWWRAVAPLTLAALLLDVAANYTELVLLTLDWPQSGEYTFSKRLRRLVLDTGWRGFIAEHIKAYLNTYDPNHV